MKIKITLAVLCLTLVGFGRVAQAQIEITSPPLKPNTKITVPDQKTLALIVAAPLVKKYADTLEARLKGKSVGYAFVVAYDDGKIIEARAGGQARRAPDSDPRSMTVNDKFNIASVSKTITAAALLKLLNEKNIDVDTPVYSYLPPDWTLGDNFKTVTFRELLTHRSGLRCAKEVTYDNLKECVAGGIKLEDKQKDCKGNKNGGICYNNSNFALFRVVIPRLFVPNFTVPAGETASSYYAKIYTSYVQRHIFLPLGLTNIQNKPTDALPGLDYQFPKPIIAGTDFGDMTETNASRGWNMSAKQLSTFISNLLFSEKVLPQAVREKMKSEGLGIFVGTLTGDVKEYGHGGYYPGKQDDGVTLFNPGELNSLILGFSNRISVALIINSQLGPGLSPTDEAKAAMKEVLK